VGGSPDFHLNLLVYDEDGEETTDDAAVLEFDVISTNTCTLLFRYVYSSEELGCRSSVSSTVKE
jgi:hypothetical protein